MRQLLLAISLVCGFTQASTLIHNINGYSINDGKLKSFKAMSFEDGKVTELYETNPNSDGFTNVIDGQNRFLLPGLIDAHGHVLGYGNTLTSVNLVGSKSLKDALSRVTEFAKANPDATWIRGRGWNQELWPSRAFPSKADLDELGIDKPIVLERVDGHAFWVNTKALSIANLNDSTLDPDGGEFIKDENGKVTGILIDNAMNFVLSVMPAGDIDIVKATLLKSMSKLASVGLTSVHDAGIDYLTYRAYLDLAKEKAMPIRVYAMLDVTDPMYPAMLEEGFINEDAHKLSIRSVKISSDGALGSRGAALHEEYSDQPGNFGLLLHSREDLNAITKNAMENGFQVNTHAIGDKANTLTLDSFANWIDATKTRELRHRVEHAQVLRWNELSRFVDMGVIASMQPTHATSDKNMAEDRVGSERIKGAYAWQSLYKTGAIIAGGSDFPVEPAEPFFGLHAAVTRQDRDNLPAGGWYINEGVTRFQALQMFTIDAAYSAHQDEVIGSLEPGKMADFILVDQDYFEVKPSDIWKTNVLATYVAGEQVF